MRRRFWPGRRFGDLEELNHQAFHWRDHFANAREHEHTGKIPALVYEHTEKPPLQPVGTRPYDAFDRQSAGVTKNFRVRFDRNVYSVPWHLVGQTVLLRADDHYVQIFLGPKRVAIHRRCWDIGQAITQAAHERGLRAHRPRSAASELPPALHATGDVGRRYFRMLAAGRRSVRRETLALTRLVELFGSRPTTEAMDEVMRSGHVGREYVEYVLRHKKHLHPSAEPLRLGDPELDAITVAEPDLSLYDELPRPQMTRDPGEPAPQTQEMPDEP